MGCQSVTERCLETEEGPAKAYQMYYKAGEPDIRILKEQLFSQEKAQKIQWKSQNIGSNYKGDEGILY